MVESGQAGRLREFWLPVLGHRESATGSTVSLKDPLERDPELMFAAASGVRPLRNRLHVDVVVPESGSVHRRAGDGAGPYGLRHCDPDGNEVDLVPCGQLAGEAATSDWWAVFSAVACYRTPTTVMQTEVVEAAATLADRSGFPLMVDVRPGLVILDSGKDRWDAAAHGLAMDFTVLAANIQAAARGVGGDADPELPRFLQFFMDAADVAAARQFWADLLGYELDEREGVGDIYDPHRLNPVIGFQGLDAAETERRQQRNRTHFRLQVPAGQLQSRVRRAVAAGGQVLDSGGDGVRLRDPENNEVVIVAG